LGGLTLRKLRDRSNPKISSTDTYIKCHECGKLLYQHDVVDSKYCNECAEMLKTAKEMSYTRCVHCHQFFPQDNISFLGKLNLGYCDICTSKAVVCKFCGDILIPDNPNVQVCSFCFDSHSRVCVRCKRNFLPDKRHYNTCTKCYISPSAKNETVKHTNIDEEIKVEEAFDVYSLIESFADRDNRSGNHGRQTSRRAGNA